MNSNPIKQSRWSSTVTFASAFLLAVPFVGSGFLAAAHAATPSSGEEIAKVNGHAITRADLEASLSSMTEGQRAGVLKDVNSRRQILTGLIDQEVLVSEAEKQKIDQDAEYKEALATFRRGFLSSKVVEKNVAPKLTDKAAKKFYEINKPRFSTDQVHVQHILVSTEDKARELLKQIKDKKEDFQDVAEKESKDPSARNNRGDLGAIQHDSPLVQEFKDAAFAGRKDEIVGPVKTAYGYHLIKIVDKKGGRVLPYDEVELRVKNELKQELIQDYVNGVKKAAKIQIDEPALTRG